MGRVNNESKATGFKPKAIATLMPTLGWNSRACFFGTHNGDAWMFVTKLKNAKKQNHSCNFGCRVAKTDFVRGP